MIGKFDELEVEHSVLAKKINEIIDFLEEHKHGATTGETYKEK